MKRFFYFTALAAALFLSAPAFAQTPVEQVNQEISRNEEALKNAEESRKEVIRRCEHNIDQSQKAIKRAEERIDDAKAAKKTASDV